MDNLRQEIEKRRTFAKMCIRDRHKICAYIYELANAFNGFYHDTKILSEENEELKKSYISLLVLTKEILEACIDMLGFSAPDRM